MFSDLEKLKPTSGYDIEFLPFFSYLSLQPNKMAFTENWKYTISRMEDTKSYLFKRYITNILKYNNILSEYETSFRSELRTALSGRDPRIALA